MKYNFFTIIQHNEAEMALPSNPDYLMNFVCNDPQLDVICSIPELVALSVRSQWEARLPATINEAVQGLGLSATTSAIVRNYMLAFNANVMKQSFTHQMWITTAPIEQNFTLLFDAETDAYNDVMQPIKDLMGAALPYRKTANSDLLYAPGPTPVQPNKSKLSLRIGRMMYWDSVILYAGSPTFETRLESNGKPIAAQIEVTIQSLTVPARDDLDNIM